MCNSYMLGSEQATAGNTPSIYHIGMQETGGTVEGYCISNDKLLPGKHLTQKDHSVTIVTGKMANFMPL